MNNFLATREIRTFDVDAFISDVYNKFAGTPNEESREDLQALWNKVLTMPRGGDASLYPNAHGPRPALLEVWHKAGDFWRANGFSKPARLLCDQYGIAIDEKTAQRIAAAKADISNTDNATATNVTEATETPQDAQADASGITVQPASATPVQAAEMATAATVNMQAEASDLASDSDDYDPGVIVPEAAYSSPTTRRHRTSRYRPYAPLPSLFDGCEITESTDAPAETPACDETVTDSHAFATAIKEIANNKTAREVAKGIGILAAVLIIYECGLIIPFALLGGLAGGFIK